MQPGKEPDPITNMRNIIDPTDPDRRWLVDYGNGQKPDATPAEAALRFARLNDPDSARDIAPYMTRLRHRLFAYRQTIEFRLRHC